MRPRAAVIAFIISLIPVVAWADVSGTIALPAGTDFSFDSGAIVASGGDVLWTGTTLNPQGLAKLVNLGNAEGAAATVFDGITQSELAALPYSTAAIPASELTGDDIFAVSTNGGNYAKVLVTVLSGTTLAFEYVTYGVTGGGSGAPTVGAVVNNYSGILPGLPNYGIAPGSLFIVGGLNLANVTTPLQSSAQAGGLQTLLDGVTVSVTVGSTTKLC